MKVVVFDVVGTLVEPWPRVSRAYTEAGRRHGVEVREDVIAARFAVAWRQQEVIDAAATPAFATSRRREHERWRGIVEEVFDRSPASNAIFRDLWEHFARPEAWRPLAEGTQMVEDVKQSGGEVALASNFDERLFEIARVVEPLTLADHVFASSELGWRKPAVEFFREVERRLGRRPEELILVGDDLHLDIAAARRAGWDARPVAGAAV